MVLNTCLVLADTGTSNTPAIRSGSGDDDNNTVMAASDQQSHGMLIAVGIIRTGGTAGTVQLRLRLETGTLGYTILQSSILKFRKTSA